MKIWKLLPIYYIIELLKLCYNKICIRNNKIIPDKYGYINPYDIFKSNDKLRREQAPFTGDYYKFIDEEINSYCCKKNSPIEIINSEGIDVTYVSIEEHDQGWKTTTHSTFPDKIIKFIEWHTTARINGVNRQEGEHKRTYEIINQLGGISSYSLDRIPLYSMNMRLEEGLNYHLALQASYRSTYHAPASGREFIGVLSLDTFVEKTYYKYKKEKEKRIAKQNNWGIDKQDINDPNKNIPKKKKTKAEKNDAKGHQELYGAHNEEDLSESESSSSEEDAVYGFNNTSDNEYSSASESDEEKLF